MILLVFLFVIRAHAYSTFLNIFDLLKIEQDLILSFKNIPVVVIVFLQSKIKLPL